jgi:Aromatic-ring-opening dioxygenase LigAB, LigA subunit
MSAYQIQKFIWELDRNPPLKKQFKADQDSILNTYPLTDDEKRILKEVDAWALRKLAVHPILIRQYTRIFGIEHEKIFTHSPHFSLKAKP